MSEPKTPAATEKELRDAFKKFDRDGNGTISSEEFTAIVTRPGGGQPLTIDQAARLFRRADLNSDGVVDYGEFCKSWGVIRGGGDSPKLADLQAPDAKHLMLGINLEGLREACELVGFPFGYPGSDPWGPYQYSARTTPRCSGSTRPTTLINTWATTFAAPSKCGSRPTVTRTSRSARCC